MSQEINVQDIYPLAPLQEGLLFHWLLDKKSTAYFTQMELKITGTLHIDIIEKSFNQLIKRYDILRTVFIYEKVKKPIQVVLKERRQRVYVEDIRRIGEKSLYIKDFKRRDREKGFDLSKDILTRLAVLRSGENEYTIIWSIHHILTDGWSLGIIWKDLMRIYDLLKKGLPMELKPVVPYRNYIQWLNRNDRKEGLKYWQEYLENCEQKAALPKKCNSHNDVKYELERHDMIFNEALTAGLSGVAKENQATINIAIQTIWGILLHRYNNVDDVVFGVIVSARPSEIEGIEDMVGLFINTIPVRIKIKSDQPFSQLLAEVQQNAALTKPYEYLSLADVQGMSSLKMNLIDHIMIFENYPVQEEVKNVSPREYPEYVIDRVDIREQTNYDFNIYIAPGDRLSVGFSFNSSVYDRETVKNIVLHFEKIVFQVIENSDKEVKRIEMITEDEKREILIDFNDTDREYPIEKTIHELIEEQAASTPNRIAVIGTAPGAERKAYSTAGRNALSYRELNEKANQLARVIGKKGVKPGAIAGIMVERSCEMIIAILAVLKAGGTFLPIDFEYPGERISGMMKDSAACILLTKENLLRKFHRQNFQFKSEIIDIFEKTLYTVNTRKLENRVTPHDPAYVIYTSGSTGKPKGVMIRHRNVVNFIKAIISKIEFSTGKTILALTTISFDIFVLETLLPLACGLRVVIANEAQQNDPKQLESLILQNRVDMVQITPSRLKLLMNGSGHIDFLNALETLLVGGEAFPDDLLESLRGECEFKGKIYNLYGPTETTIWSMLKDLTGEEPVTIGTPVSNTKIYITDRYQRLQPVGVVGELYLGGHGVGLGYLNNPELTAEKFILTHSSLLIADRAMRERTARFPISYQLSAISYIYRSGDLARWLPDGNVQCLGRVDHQAKIRGFRIELGEIESQLLTHEEIKEAVVIDRKEKNGDKYLCAYFVSGRELTVSEVSETLSKELPGYMIPSYFMRLERIPLTPNGKVDRKSLPVIQGARPKLEAAYVTAETSMEKTIGRCWRELLEIDEVGMNDNFFELGGNSNKIIQLNSRLKVALETDVPVLKMFEYPTIRSLARYLEGNGRGTGHNPGNQETNRIDQMDHMNRSVKINEGKNRLKERYQKNRRY